MIPPSVSLHGIEYAVSYVEGAIIFSEREHVFGQKCKLMFQRKCGCWCLSIHGTGSDTASVGHIQAAFDFVCQWFGGDFEMKNGENLP